MPWARPCSAGSCSRGAGAKSDAGGREIRAHYGYADGSGEYYITVDTDRCDGCGDCLPACPRAVFEVVEDDYEELMAVVKAEHAQTLGDVCLGFDARCAGEEINCHAACPHDAIEHSW